MLEKELLVFPTCKTKLAVETGFEAVCCFSNNNCCNIACAGHISSHIVPDSLTTACTHTHSEVKFGYKSGDGYQL